MKREIFIKALLISPVMLVSKSCFSNPQSGLENVVDDNNNKVFLVDITSNHGHLEIDLMADDIQNDKSGLYELTGGNHTHPFSLSPFQIATLKTGTELSILVTGNFHSHNLTIFYGNKLPTEGD